jgi:hypothetical protein
MSQPLSLEDLPTAADTPSPEIAALIHASTRSGLFSRRDVHKVLHLCGAGQTRLAFGIACALLERALGDIHQVRLQLFDCCFCFCFVLCCWRVSG